VKLAAARQGQGQPLILLHGLLGSSDNLQPLAKALSANFDVFCPDLRNHGRSPHDPQAGFAAMAADIAEAMQDLGWAQAHVLGHSLGAKVAMRLALDRPSLVSKLVAADMGPKAYPQPFPEVFAALEALDLKSVKSRGEAELSLGRKIADQATRFLMLKNLGRDESGNFYWKMNVEALQSPELGEAIASAEPYTGPTLFIRGEKSDYVQDSDWPGILKLFPQARLETLKAAGHWLHAQQAAAFASLVENFLLTN
jgi:esterase